MTVFDGSDPYFFKPPSGIARLRLADLFAAPDRPLEVELGCGKGRFLAMRARAAPAHNFLGVDRQLRRLRKVSRKARHEALPNLKLLRLENAYLVEHLLPLGAVSVFYIFFPDPWPKRRHRRRRLFQPAFLRALHQALIPRGAIHIRTDHLEYAEEIKALFAGDPGFMPTAPLSPGPEEYTEFEALFLALGKPIARLAYQRGS